MMGVLSGVITAPCVDGEDEVAAVSFDGVLARGTANGDASRGNFGRDVLICGSVPIGPTTGELGFEEAVEAEVRRDDAEELYCCTIESLRGDTPFGGDVIFGDVTFGGLATLGGEALGGEGALGGVKTLGGEYVRGEPSI